MTQPRTAAAWLTAAVALAACVLAAAADHRAVAAPRCFGAEAHDPDHPCDPGALRYTVSPTPYEAVLQPGAYCRPYSASPRVCTFGVPSEDAREGIAIVGDSHGAHWRAALRVVARRRHWRGYSMTRNNCPFELAHTTGKGMCGGYADSVIAFLRRHPQIHTVFASQNHTSGVSIPRGETYVQAKVGGFLRAWRALPKSVTRVIVLHDVPRASVTTKSCVSRAVARHQDAGARCGRARHLAVGVDLEFAAANRSDDDRGFGIDLTPFMCGPRFCQPVIGGALVIRDIGHLTTTFSASLGGPLDRAITALEDAHPTR